MASVFDAGCGDMNWQRFVDGIDSVRYVGADVVRDVVAANQREFAARGNFSFVEHDLVRDPLPGAHPLKGLKGLPRSLPRAPSFRAHPLKGLKGLLLLPRPPTLPAGWTSAGAGA